METKDFFEKIDKNGKCYCPEGVIDQIKLFAGHSGADLF